MIFNRVHLLELGHVRSTESSRFALGFRKFARVELLFLGFLSVALSSQLRLDLLSLLSKLVHHRLRLGAQFHIGVGTTREAECEVGSWDSDLGRG